jgi:hypothetical protein
MKEPKTFSMKRDKSKKTLEDGRDKSKKTLEDGKISHAHELVGSTL